MECPKNIEGEFSDDDKCIVFEDVITALVQVWFNI